MMNKFLRRTLLFLIVPVFISVFLFYLFSSLINSFTKEYLLDENITEIFIGDSHIQSSVDDNLLINAKNLGQSSESFYFSYSKLKKLLENNPNVKRVYLGFSYHSLSDYYDKFISGEYSVSVSPHYFYILPAGEQIRQLNWNKNNISTYVKSIIKAGKRSMFNERDKNLFSGFSNDFIYSTAVDSSMNKRLKFQFYSDDGLRNFSELNLLYLSRIVELCKMRSIELTAINTPLHPGYRNKIPFAFIQKYIEVCNQNSLKVSDFSKMVMVDSCYTPDGDHVSNRGAKQMTKQFIGNRLQ